jgi:hypothetical protein
MAEAAESLQAQVNSQRKHTMSTRENKKKSIQKRNFDNKQG